MFVSKNSKSSSAATGAMVLDRTPASSTSRRPQASGRACGRRAHRKNRERVMAGGTRKTEWRDGAAGRLVYQPSPFRNIIRSGLGRANVNHSLPTQQPTALARRVLPAGNAIKSHTTEKIGLKFATEVRDLATSGSRGGCPPIAPRCRSMKTQSVLGVGRSLRAVSRHKRGRPANQFWTCRFRPDRMTFQDGACVSPQNDCSAWQHKTPPAD